MNRTIALTLLAGLALGGGAFAGGSALAQAAPGGDGHGPGQMEMHGPGPMEMHGPGPMEMHGPGPMGDHGPGPMGMRGPGPMGMWRRMREFALLYPARDRNLSGPDVQKIAEAFLLLNGNHSWKITDVKEEPNRVTFAVAVGDGTAIAHFAMDRHTARPERLD